MRRYLGQLLEGAEALAALRRGVQLLQAAVDAQVQSSRSPPRHIQIYISLTGL